jgi:serralysin
MSVPSSFRPGVEALEDRFVPAAPSVFAVGSVAGSAVDVYDAATGQFKYGLNAFEGGYNGGVRVAVGSSAGQDYLVAAAGPGGYLVRTFLLGQSGATLVNQFEPFGTFAGGINVAVGDLRGDGGLEIVTAADAGGAPLVTVNSLSGQQISPNILAFSYGFTGGVRVAVGDFSGTGRDDIAAAAGPGGLPFVQLIDGRTYQAGTRFLAFDPRFADGLYVAAGRLDNSGVDRLVVGAGGGHAYDEPVLREFDAAGDLLHDYVYAFDSSYHGGVAVSMTPPASNGLDNILADPVGDHSRQVQALDATFAHLGAYTAPDGASFDLLNQKLTDWNNLGVVAAQAALGGGFGLNGLGLNGLAGIGGFGFNSLGLSGIAGIGF